MRSCSHCGTRLEAHTEENAKKGALHCYGCGCCFQADGVTLRDGVPVCGRVVVATVQEAPVEPDPASPIPGVVEERPDEAEPGEQVDEHGLEPVLEPEPTAEPEPAKPTKARR